MNLKIINSNELFDFQKTGNFYNHNFGIYAPADNVLSIEFFVKGGSAITTFEAKRIKFVGDSYEILETIDMTGRTNIEYYGNRYYYFLGNEIQDTALDDGFWFYEFSDGTFAKKSEIFCIKGVFIGYSGVVFNIFASGYSSGANIVLDNSGHLLHFTLNRGRCLYSTNDVIMKFADHFDLDGYSILNKGTSVGTIDVYNKQITFSLGTIYGLDLIHATKKDLLFPFIEFWNYVYDVNCNERVKIKGGVWNVGVQNDYFYEFGMEKITDLYFADTFWIPFNQFGASCYNVNSIETNLYKSGVSYTINQIFKNSGTSYRVTSNFTSTYFSNDTANFTAF
ncbi:MAG: hypothetical protein GY849_02420 [Deltaproteobacteria bacterium]|nr:hypothetical protein [Deltaproteobacteria bacterium]